MHMCEIERSLENTDADGSLRYLEVPADPSPGEHSWVTRCRRRYLERHRIPGSRRSVRLPRRHPFGDDMNLFVGDTWINLRSTAVRHVLAQVERHPELRRYFEWCGSPDEAYLPTLLLNDADELVLLPHRRRYIEWEPGSPHPRVLDVSSFDVIVDSGDYFVRKVDPTISADLLDRLDAKAAAAFWNPSDRGFAQRLD